MKLLITRLRIPRPAEHKGRPSHRRHKVLTVLLGTALTLGVCLAAENISRRKAVPASVPAPEGKALPVICYSQVLTDGEKGGKRTVSADMLRQDLAWLADHHCETVSCSQVIGFARGLEQLSEKPVLLLFDGSWETILTVVLPLLEEQNAKAAAVICGSDADLYSAQVPKKEEDARLSWNEIRLLDQSPLVELVSGTYDLRQEKGSGGRRGVSMLRKEGFETYRAFLADDLLALQNRMNEELSHDASVFCYPFGEKSGESEAVLKDLGFLMTLSEGDGIARISNKNSLFGIPFTVRDPEQTAEEFFGQIGLGEPTA